MRNFITLLAILFTGMVIAQRPNISRTISGTIFNVTQAGSTNDLAISTMGTYKVLDGDLLNPLYVHNSMSIPVREISDLINPNYEGRIEVLGFESLSWHSEETVDWMEVLDRHSLPRDLSGSIRILGEELGRFREFRLTLNIGSFVLMINEDATEYTVSVIGIRNVFLNEIASYRGSNGICMPLPIHQNSDGRYFEILRPGRYTVTSQSSSIEYIHGEDLSMIDLVYGVAPACSN